MRPGSIYPIYVIGLFYICSIQNADTHFKQKATKQQKVQEKHLCFCLCPSSRENDLNNMVGIDDIRDQWHKGVRINYGRGD